MEDIKETDENENKENQITEEDMKRYFSIIENDENIFLILRDNLIVPKNLMEIFDREKKKNKFLTLIFDIDDLSKAITDISKYFQKVIEQEEGDYEDMNLNIIIKNCLVKNNNSLFVEDKKLKLNNLYISDELHSMSPDLNQLFKSFLPKILYLKSIKINSKLQLENFFNFIINTECEELVLEDFFIELIIKRNDNDETYNDLDEYFYFENGHLFINNYRGKIENEETKEVKKKEETKLTKLKLIDCPLFAITGDTFKDINKYKNIDIDIDENSLLNPSIITRFRINKGLSDFCFDLDSYKLNKEEDDDYIENLEYIINKIINNNNNEYNKLIFKNFDITKYEYITGENLTYIKEENWVLNEEEKKRKEKFEEFDKEINDKINENLNKLSKVKSLVFDNCSNHFIQLILKFIKSSKNELDLLKLKKCGKEYFNIKNILSLKINNLILFDTPLIIDSFFEDKLKIENLTIKINTLQFYCNENNLNYDKTIENYIELINHQKLNQNLIFEMNTIPILIKHLKKGNSQSTIKGLKNKAIIIKNNYIRHYKINPKTGKTKKSEEIIQEFDTDINYSSFVNSNKIETVILKDCNFEESFSFINFINKINDKDKKYIKIDIKSLNEYIYKNQSFDNYANFFNHLIKTRTSSTEIELNQYNNIKKIKSFKEHLTKLFEILNNDKFTIIFSDIKEIKEFYCLLNFFEEMENNDNFIDYELSKSKERISFLSSDNFKNLKKNLGLYFLYEKSELKQEDNFFTVFNYYYSSEDERNMFGEYGKEENKKIQLGKYIFIIEYFDNSENNELKKVDPWEVL